MIVDLGAILIAVMRLSARYQMEPELIAAVIQVESGFKAEAVGLLGEQGLMQLRPEYFGRFRPDQWELSLEAGVRHMAKLKASCPHREANTFVVCHNLGIKRAGRIQFPRDQTYYKRVMGAYNAFKLQEVRRQSSYAGIRRPRSWNEYQRSLSSFRISAIGREGAHSFNPLANP